MSLFDTIFARTAAPALNDFGGDIGVYDYQEPDQPRLTDRLMIRMSDSDEQSFGDKGTVWERVTTFAIPKNQCDGGIPTIYRGAQILSATEDWNITRIVLETTTYTQVEAVRVRNNEFVREGLRE